MATITQSISDASGFSPIAWALEALPVLRRNLVLCKAISMDTDISESGWQGKTLNIPYPGTFVAQDKTAGTPVTPQAPTGNATTALTLSKHKVVDFLVEDYAAAQASSMLMQRYIQPAIVAIAEQIETDLFTMLANLSLTPVGTAGTNLNAATLFAAMKTLNIAKAPQTGRSVVISAKDQAAVLQDTTLQNYFAFSQPTDLEEGKFGRFGGMDIYMSQFIDGAANNQGTQVLTITATGGTYTLTYNGQTTTAIAYNANAATIQAALVALTSIGAGGATVTGTGPFNLILSGVNAGAPLLFTVGTGSLTGGTATLANGATTSTYNVAFQKAAMLMAMRQFAPIPPDSGVATATIVDEQSGIALRVLKQYKADYRAEYVGFDVLYGFTALRPNQGLVVLS